MRGGYIIKLWWRVTHTTLVFETENDIENAFDPETHIQTAHPICKSNQPLREYAGCWGKVFPHFEICVRVGGGIRLGCTPELFQRIKENPDNPAQHPWQEQGTAFMLGRKGKPSVAWNVFLMSSKT
jgi:hypothetical protein